MKLLLDLGNTRLKAALGDDAGGLRMLGQAAHREQGAGKALEAVLDELAGETVDSAWCANVAGDAAGRELAAAVRLHAGVPTRFVRAVPEACGVRCAYPEPAHLGADRWAALLGARALTGAACLVADAGSALTLDAMAAGGRHLGGWILPGHAMMLEALAGRTGDLGRLRAASAADPEGGFPVDSGPAMEAGARLAALGAVRAAREQLRAHAGGPARLLVTGGDADFLLTRFADAEHAPALVLRGLARLAAAGGCAT